MGKYLLNVNLLFVVFVLGVLAIVLVCANFMSDYSFLKTKNNRIIMNIAAGAIVLFLGVLFYIHAMSNTNYMKYGIYDYSINKNNTVKVLSVDPNSKNVSVLGQNGYLYYLPSSKYGNLKLYKYNSGDYVNIRININFYKYLVPSGGKGDWHRRGIRAKLNTAKVKPFKMVPELKSGNPTYILGY